MVLPLSSNGRTIFLIVDALGGFFILKHILNYF